MNERVEFALEGLHWSDISDGKIGPKAYPIAVKGEKQGIS